MKKALFSPMIFAFLTLVILMMIPNSWIAQFISKQRVYEAATELNPCMFQGKYIQSKMLVDNRYLPIYGSSELSRLDAFHPSNYFQENKDGFIPFLIGRGGSISIIHFLNFAEHTQQLKGKKIVFILSPQWFQPRGADEPHFVPNYSTVQGYDLAFNKTIDPKIKKQAIKRLLKFTPVKNDQILSILYNAEISNNPWIKQEALLVRPLAYAYRGVLEKKDLYYSLLGEIPKHREIKWQVRNKSWAQLKKQADLEGKKQSRHNPFCVLYSWYKKIKIKGPLLRNSQRGASYGRSVEYYDFDLMLDLLKESGAKPLFISIPVNGRWYDYTGFPKKGRIAYYKRIKHQVEAKGFPIADFSGHEYDPYFMKDTMHIGWKGWVYVDKAIKDFYDAKAKTTLR